MIKLLLSKNFKSLNPFSIELPDFVILTGLNGAGKTQLLTGIMSNYISVFDEKNSLIDPKKYITSNSLSPTDNTVVTKEQLNSVINTLVQNFQQYIQNKAKNPNYSLTNTFGSNASQIKLIEKIAKSADKKIDDLDTHDFFNHYPLDDGLDQKEIFYQNFSSLFKRYQDKLEENEYKQYRNEVKKEKEISFFSKEDFVFKFGEPPWDFVNKIILGAKLDYKINPPFNSHRDAPYELKLININNNAQIKFSDLSSGEKVLMSLALALYNSKFDIIFPKLLLMDEPDASLHPSMSKQLIDVIQNVFVREKKVKVILTTHSSSTIALAPEEAIFTVNKTGNRLEKASKDKALKILTSGVPSFSINYENRRQVFVESQNDVLYYEKIYQKLLNHLEPEISLSFISSGESRTDKNGMKVSNCDQVINITNILRKAGNKFIWGIIDWDLKNAGNEFVRVLGKENRYSIENYLLDPILIAALLLREKIISKTELQLAENENFTDLKNFDVTKIQFIVDFIINKISTIIKPTNSEVKTITYLNGIEICLPVWFLHFQGHSLENVLIEAFPELKSIKRNKEEALKLEILEKIVDDLPEFLCADLINLFIEIQSNQ